MPDTRPEVGDRVPAAEAALAAALQAFESQDWSALVDLTDAGSVVTLKESYLRQREWDAKQAENARWQPSIVKPEFQEEFEREHRELMANRREFGELAGVRSIEEVDALTPAEFLIRWAQARHGEYLVDGKEPWHRQLLERRVVVGSVAVLPDTVAVLVRDTRVDPSIGAGGHEMIAMLGNNRGGWAVDAETGWLGLSDSYF